MGCLGGNLCLWGPERFFSVVRNTESTYAFSGRANNSLKLSEKGRKITKMPEQFFPFHIAICSSRKSIPTADRASCRLNSRASFSVALRVSSNCSCVLSWQFTPGTSSIHPIQKPLSCLVTAVYTLFIIAPSIFHLFPKYTPPVYCTF